ncbi:MULTISPECIES: transporter [Pseudomonas]|uniref:transporter n=1 Tax=Pseudomonas TaxID=286 RepID=UPI0006B41E65|nr:transporter [Pseudomonas fuscovaginae]KPA98703.1 protein involved in meta-pathway of phenol degradation [Pseudomonas fuscovaginae]
MKSPHAPGFTAALALTTALGSTGTQAADLNARDFVSAPVGTTLGVFYLPMTRDNDYHGRANSTGRADLNVNALAWRQLIFTDICGTLCTPQFIVPFADIDARLPGATSRSHESGFGDPQVGGTLYLINNPASRTYSGFLSLISLPVGEYHSQNPDVSPGANRWAGHFVYNFTQGIGEKWLLEANLEAQVYGKNDDYYGSTLKQDPLYRLQAFASYDFTPATYGALRLIHADGGELRLNDNRLADTHQRYTQVGFELGHWFDKRNQGLLALTRNVDTDNGYHGSQALLRLVHVF